jgi:hypothetical protein
MLDEIRIQINEKRHCMLIDGNSILSLCIIPCYGDGDLGDQIKDNGEFAHLAPVLLDCFYDNFGFKNWDLTTKRVSDKIAFNFTFYAVIILR